MIIAPVYIYRATLDRVVDGDTFYLWIDLGFYIKAKKLVRLHNVNCPESSKPGGAEATSFVRSLLQENSILVKTYKDQRSFTRWICDVWVETAHEPVSVASTLVANGHAVEVAYSQLANS